MRVPLSEIGKTGFGMMGKPELFVVRFGTSKRYLKAATTQAFYA